MASTRAGFVSLEAFLVLLVPKEIDEDAACDLKRLVRDYLHRAGTCIVSLETTSSW
jgi:hypothetical protein